VLEARIRVGVAGWDYADWQGPVYPARTAGRLDRLAYLARFVDVIEINTTFYRPVAPGVAESWNTRTRDAAGLCFTAKAHRSLTHDVPPAIDAGARATRDGLRPLQEAGRLGALLLQYPQSVRFVPAALARIEAALDALRDFPLVVEVRHRSWESDEAAAWVGARGAGLCAVDQPRLATTARLRPRVTAGPAYIRLHGRNARSWFDSGAGRDARYDYLYDAAQLGEIAGAARAMARESAAVFVVQNNHFRGQALVNALQMKALLEQAPPLAPDCLIAAYPELARQARSDHSRLF